MERFGKPQVDLFATRNNAQVKHFFSRFVDEDALGTDALAQYWLQDLVYGNPPWRLIMPVLRKLATEPHGRCILVLPKWPSAAWWPLVMHMSDEVMHIRTDANTFLAG